jgi:hypothetical protein
LTLAALLSLAVVGLGIIAYQLQRIRRRLDQDSRMAASAQEQQGLDDTIREACPHLFQPLKQELRDWFAIRKRKRGYNDERERFGDVIDPHSDEDASWHDVFSRLLKHANNDQEKTALHELGEVTDRLLKEAATATVLTPAEGDYLAFQAWRDLLSVGVVTSKSGEPLVLPVEASLARTIAPYRREPQG